jgi:nucleoside-diphosphate-sugar epimerase
VTIFVTGATGNVGPALLESLQGHRVIALARGTVADGFAAKWVTGALDDLPWALAEEVDVIIHAAADTRFRAPLADLRQTNVVGTAAMLEFARRCPRLRRFIHISTVCVSGTNTGEIPELRRDSAPEFLNAYEQTKWEAEQLVFASGLPADVVRLPTIAGSEIDGSTVRLGALHHAVHWLWRGLIPMLPGNPDTTVDVISSEHAARVIRAVLDTPAGPERVVHAAAGRHSPSLSELLDCTFERFAFANTAWKRGVIARPAVADAKTWHLFARAAEQSGDALYRRVLDDAQSFLPGLLHARRYRTDFSDAHVSTPDWREVVTLAVDHLIHTNWHQAHA